MDAGSLGKTTDVRHSNMLIEVRERRTLNYTNEADEALLRSAQASTDEPLGALTDTQQVMSRAFDLSLMAVCDDTKATGGVPTGGIGFDESTCKRV